MFSIVDKKGAWINQYAQPTVDVFVQRARQVDYLIIKYGLSMYEKLATDQRIPWLAERMAEGGAGDQSGPSQWERYATELANQARQPGCVGAVINLEEADGGWHSDNGNGTRALINKFRTLAPGVPLYASLDTRGQRPGYMYQQVCAELCDGVMPMVYPKAFMQTPAVAMGASVNQLVKERWQGKPIIPTLQTYDDVGGTSVAGQIVAARVVGVGWNVYTLGHAAPGEWAVVAGSGAMVPTPIPSPTPAPITSEQLLRARVGHLEALLQLASKGTADELLAYAQYWKRATSGGSG